MNSLVVPQTANSTSSTNSTSTNPLTPPSKNNSSKSSSKSASKSSSKSISNSSSKSSKSKTSPTSSTKKPPSKLSLYYQQVFGKHGIKLNRSLNDLIVVIVTFYGMLYGSQLSSLYTCQENKFLNNHAWVQYTISFGIFYFVCIIVTSNFAGFPPIQKLINCLIYFVTFILLNRLDYRLVLIVLFLIAVVYFNFLNKQYYFTVSPGGVVIVNDSITTASNVASSITRNSKKHLLSDNASQKDIQKVVKEGIVSTTSPAFIADHQYWLTWDVPFRIRWFKVQPYQYYVLTYINRFLIFIIVVLVLLGLIGYVGLAKYSFNNKVNWYMILIDTPRCVPLKTGLPFFDYVRLAINYNHYIKLVKK
jgi:hypothetical protein